MYLVRYVYSREITDLTYNVFIITSSLPESANKRTNNNNINVNFLGWSGGRIKKVKDNRRERETERE